MKKSVQFGKKNLKLRSSLLLYFMLMAFCHSAAFSQAYYYNGSGSITSLSSWGSNTNGSGTIPGSFNQAGNTYYIANTSGTVAMSADWTVGSSTGGLNIASGIVLNINGYTLDVTGALSGTGTLGGSSTSNLTLTGTVGTLNFNAGVRTLRKLTLNASTTATLGSGTLTIAGGTGAANGVVTVGSSSILTTGGNLLLGANATGTAAIGVSSGTISGNVQIQMYLPGGTRGFSLLGHPYITSHTLNELTAIDVTGTGGSTNGFTTTATNNPSAFWYNVANSNGSTTNDLGWTAYTNTTGGSTANTWDQYEGLRVMVRGTTGQGLAGEAYTSNAVTLTMNADQINQGTKVANVTKGAGSIYAVVSNPFPCPIEMSAITRAAGIATFYYCFNSSGIVTAKLYSSSFVLPAYASFITGISSSSTITFPESCKRPNTTPGTTLSRITVPGGGPGFPNDVIDAGPTFTSISPQNLSVCQNAGATDIKSLLHVSYYYAGQTLTWSQQSAPAHGTLTVTSATSGGGGTNITPGGTIKYQPASGYSGSDAFTVRVSDGANVADMVVNVTVNPLTIITSSSNQTHDVSSDGGNYTDGSCNVITTVQPSGASPVSGNVTSKVWIESSVPVQGATPYVARHYEITPAANASTATGTVTLYFLQSEFTAFNAVTGSILDLPTGPGDATGIANLRISKFSGTSSDNSGLPSSYSSGGIVINPNDANFVWNASASRWEITFDVVGFSGFFVQSTSFTLPVTLISFTAEKSEDKVLLRWKTASESNSKQFVIEHSTDGRNFATVGTVAAAGTSNSVRNYSFTHNTPVKETNFYRIQQVDIDGRSYYSETRKINFSKTGNGFTILVNPVTDGKLQVQFEIAAEAAIYNTTGQLKAKQAANAGSQIIDVRRLPEGMYILKSGNESKKFVIK